MSPPTALRFSSKALLTFGLTVLSFAPKADTWLLEFWSQQADCNYKIKDNGNQEAADTSRGDPDHMSNNCMMMSYDPDSDGMKAMRVTGWTEDCAIALWSSGTGSPPCQAEIPYGIGSESQKPDQVFTMKSSQVSWAEDKSFACISPLNEYVQSNSGFLGYVAYSCGTNGSMLVDEYKNDYDSDQMESLIKSLTASSTSTTASISSSHTTTKHHHHNITATTATDFHASTTGGRNKTIVTPVPTKDRSKYNNSTSASHTTFKTTALPKAPH